MVKCMKIKLKDFVMFFDKYFTHIAFILWSMTIFIVYTIDAIYILTNLIRDWIY